jgi:hypothetical protein
LNGLGTLLAFVFSALGCGILFAPWISEGLARDGYGPGFRFVVGAAHIAAGLLLLVPRFAEKVGLVLALLLVGVAFNLRFSGQDIKAGAPALLAFALLLFGAILRVRQRDDISIWRELLDRYADEDLRGSKQTRDGLPDRSGTAGGRSTRSPTGRPRNESFVATFDGKGPG